MLFERLRQSWEEHPLRTGYQILLVAACALWFEALVTCGMGFQPGWANGWPFGISKHVVFAVWATGMLQAMIVTAGAGVLAVLCSHLQQLLRLKSVGWQAFACLVVVWLFVTIPVCCYVYPNVHAAIVKDWP
jgi:hypothetical protein